MNTRRFTTIISCTLLTSYLIGCSEDAPRRNNRPTSSTPTISSVLVSADPSQVEVNKSVQLIATAKYSDGTSKDVSNAATWNSLNPTVATVNVLGVVNGLVTGNAEIQAEYEGLTGSISITVIPDTSFKELIVTPNTVILAPNDSASLSAFAIRMDDSQVNVTSSVSWSSSDSSLIQVATDGTVTAAAIPGTATITASLPETMLSASALVTVMAAELVDLEIMPGRATIALGASARLTALGTFSDGQQMDVTSMVTWSSSSESTASVNNSPGREGEVQSHSLGITSITATDDSTGVSNTITVTVTNPAVLRVDVLPRTASIGIGRNQMFEATAIYTDGSEIDVTRRVQWSSSNSAVASVSNQAGSPGLAYGIDVGTTTISALHSQSGVSSDDSATSGQLTVIPAQLTSLVVTPLQVDVNLGNVYQFVATGLYSNGTSRDISASVNWSSSNTAVATVITGTITPGRITTLSEGMSTISAIEPNTGISSNDSNRSGELTVLPPLLLSIAVSPRNANMVLTSQQPFQAFGSYSDGSTQDLTSSVVWASTASNIVSVTQSGLATANSLGMASISARETASNVSSDASNESARVIVSEASLVSINVIPTSTTIPAGAISMFMAEGTYDNGSTADVTTIVDWTTSDSMVASVSNQALSKGEVRSLAPGMATISAIEPTSGISSDLNGTSAVLSVANLDIISLSISPANQATVRQGDTEQFTSMGTFTDGSIFDVTPFVSWQSSAPMIGAIETGTTSGGLFSAIAVGTTNVSAEIVNTATISSNVTSVAVANPCDVFDLRISEVHLGTDDYGRVTNPTNCTLSLAGIQMKFDDNSLSDVTFNFPASTTLGPNQSIYVCESNKCSAPALNAGSNIGYSPTSGRSGTTLLCNGGCGNAANIIDVHQFSGGTGTTAPPGLPAGVSFSPGPFTAGSGHNSTQSFLRTSYNGQRPTFLRADWTVGQKSR